MLQILMFYSLSILPDVVVRRSTVMSAPQKNLQPKIFAQPPWGVRPPFWSGMVVATTRSNSPGHPCVVIRVASTKRWEDIFF